MKEKKTLEMPTTDVVRNRHGVCVTKGCFSCLYREFDENDEEFRVCMRNKEKHLRFHLCAHWKMRPALQKAGESGGRVKRYEYLMYFLRVRMKEEEQGIAPEDEKSFEEIQAMFEAQHGSVYLK